MGLLTWHEVQFRIRNLEFGDSKCTELENHHFHVPTCGI